MKKAILCHIHFISAVTPTMPEHRALFAPFICMIESSQPPETLSADVGDPATSDIMAATAAGTFSGFQAVCSGNMHIPAVTAAFPPGPAIFTFQFFTATSFPKRRPVRSSATGPLLELFSGIHPQSFTVPRIRCLVFTFISFPQSHLHSHTTYLFSRSSSFFSTVR